MSRIRFIFLLACVTALMGLGISLLGAEVVKKTGDEAFCGSCHDMQPMVKTFQQDTHGGNNAHGFTAECVDCHLPHNSTLGYLVSKGSQALTMCLKRSLPIRQR